MLRRTKIVATLGPVSSSEEMLEQLINAGVDVFRINFSHGKASDHVALVERVRETARSLQRTVGILVDLQGPKIRIGKFKAGKTQLTEGERFILDAEATIGTDRRVGLDYKELPNDVTPGDILLLDDGRIEMRVEHVRGPEIQCVVVQGGVLSNNKGINRKGGGLSAPALTEKDLEDIETAAAAHADFLGVSFPRSADDIQQARELFRKAGGKGMIVAKIERAEAITALDEILDATDAIMVARGDLAVEVGDAAVPALQKRMIRMARAKNRVVITATQMMESMIESPVPTRAEVSDVANAVLDGTDAVMLSGESAVGQFPIEAVEAMARVCVEAEKESIEYLEQRRQGDQQLAGIEASVAHAAVSTANRLHVKAIATMTHSGTTALLVSRLSTAVPIYALSPSVDTRRRVCLFRGVHPIRFASTTHDPIELLQDAEDELLKRNAAHPGDLIIITVGEPIGKPGGTNTMKIIRISENRSAAE